MTGQQQESMLQALMGREFDPIQDGTAPRGADVYQRRIPDKGIIQVTAWLGEPGPNGERYALTGLDNSATTRFHVPFSQGTPDAVITPAVKAAVDYVRELPGGTWSD